MSDTTYVLKFDNVSEAQANQYASELKEFLLDSTEEVTVDLNRDDPTAQDFGGTLILILGAPAVVALVNALSEWLKLRHSASITIETAEGHKIVASNITNKDVMTLAEKFNANQK